MCVCYVCELCPQGANLHMVTFLYHVPPKNQKQTVLQSSKLVKRFYILCNQQVRTKNWDLKVIWSFGVEMVECVNSLNLRDYNSKLEGLCTLTGQNGYTSALSLSPVSSVVCMTVQEVPQPNIKFYSRLDWAIVCLSSTECVPWLVLVWL